MWEQRYNALSPKRSEGNTRNYDNDQLRRLLNIVSLMDTGFKVSELCVMPDEKLFDLMEGQLKVTSASDRSGEYFISQLLAASMSFDEQHFEKIFSNCLLRNGMKNTYVKVVYPMLTRVGLMWTNNTMPPAHEHFISNLLRQKLFSAVDALSPASNSTETWLLCLPEDEFHEIGLLLANFLLRQAGKKVIYLGANVPFGALKSTELAIKPTHLLLFWVHHLEPKAAQKYLDDLEACFQETTIVLAGHESIKSKLNESKNIHWIHSVESLEKLF